MMLSNVSHAELKSLLPHYYPNRVSTLSMMKNGRDWPSEKDIAERAAWCEDNLGGKNAVERCGLMRVNLETAGRWAYHMFRFHFASQTEAAAFKLVWG